VRHPLWVVLLRYSKYSLGYAYASVFHYHLYYESFANLTSSLIIYIRFPQELAKFMVAMKQEHEAVCDRINIDDLEAML